jgi:hypothetical protein
MPEQMQGLFTLGLLQGGKNFGFLGFKLGPGRFSPFRFFFE